MIGRARRDAGFTLIELLIVVAIIGILAAMAGSRLARARIAGNEASAIGSVRAVNAAESTYASSCGAAGYAQSLDDLAKPPSGSTQAFVSADLVMNGIVKSGYTIGVEPDAGASTVTLASRTCNAATADAVSAYFVSATAVTVGSTGQRSFASDKQGAIMFRGDGAAIRPGMAGASPMQ